MSLEREIADLENRRRSLGRKGKWGERERVLTAKEREQQSQYDEQISTLRRRLEHVYEAQREQITQPQPGEMLAKGYEPGRGMKGVDRGGIRYKNPPMTEVTGVEARQLEQRAARNPPDHTSQIVNGYEAFGNEGVRTRGKRAVEGAMNLKEFVKTVQEFAHDPNFTVGEGGKIIYQDGFKFSFNDPAALGMVVKGDLKPGQRIGVDVEAVKKMKRGDVLVVDANQSAQRPAPQPAKAPPQAQEQPQSRAGNQQVGDVAAAHEQNVSDFG